MVLVTSNTKPRCSVTVHGTGYGWGGSPCANNGKVQIGGKWFCGIHDPGAAKARRAKRLAKYEAGTAARKAERERLRREPHICRTCGLGHDPR